MTTKNPRASTDRANVLPLPPVNIDTPAHPAPAKVNRVSRRVVMNMLVSAAAISNAKASDVKSSPDAELIELGREWEIRVAERNRAKELAEPNERAWGQALAAIHRENTVGGVLKDVPNSVYLEAAARVDAKYPLPSPTLIDDAWWAVERVERQIMALQATTAAGLAIKARMAKEFCPNLWAKSEEDSDYRDLLIRHCIDAVIASGEVRS